LQKKTANNLVSVGCSADIVQRAVLCAAASDCLPVDVLSAVGKICQHFRVCAVRVEAVKFLCELTEAEYKAMLGHSKRWWLFYLPAIERNVEFSLSQFPFP
jgi:hypothetical protein